MVHGEKGRERDDHQNLDEHDNCNNQQSPFHPVPRPYQVLFYNVEQSLHKWKSRSRKKAKPAYILIGDTLRDCTEKYRGSTTYDVQIVVPIQDPLITRTCKADTINDCAHSAIMARSQA